MHEALTKALESEMSRCDASEETVAAALLVAGEEIVARGHHCRLRTRDPLRYAVMDCMSNAGRRTDQSDLTLYVSATPNWLEAGTIVQFGVGAVVLATDNPNDHDSRDDATIAFLRSHGVNVRRDDRKGDA